MDPAVNHTPSPSRSSDTVRSGQIHHIDTLEHRRQVEIHLGIDRSVHIQKATYRWFVCTRPAGREKVEDEFCLHQAVGGSASGSG